MAAAVTALMANLSVFNAIIVLGNTRRAAQARADRAQATQAYAAAPGAPTQVKDGSLIAACNSHASKDCEEHAKSTFGA